MKDLEVKYRALLNDPAFDKLEQLLKSPNIFSILKIERREIRHSNFLAWLLDPKANHGLGNIFLKRLLCDLAISHSNIFHIKEVESLPYDTVRVKREWFDIDILIIFPKLVICIENKIDHKEKKGQLTKYRNYIKKAYPGRKKLYVFLTPDGRKAQYDSEFMSYSYEQIAENLSVLLSKKELVNPKVTTYVEDYVINLNRKIMGNDEANKIAKRIYINHRELIDFINKNIPDILKEFQQAIIDKITGAGYIQGSRDQWQIRFLTPQIQNIIPKSDYSTWTNKESFAYEILCSNEKIQIKATLPTMDKPVFNLLKKVLGDNFETWTENESEWYLYYFKELEFSIEDIYMKGEEEMKKWINAFWPNVEEIVRKTEPAILQVQKELLEIKQNREEQP